jgi:hypothetical protein
MKKILIALLLVLLMGATISSCTTTSRTGCFATSKMVGYD